MKFLSIFSPNLRQLRVCFLINNEDVVDKIVIEVEQSKIILTTRFKLEIIVEPFFKLIPVDVHSVSGLNSANCLDIQLIIPVDECNIEEPSQHVFTSVHPVNQELMSDWIYCHNHGHSNSHGDTNGHQLNTNNSIIRKREEIVSFLKDKPIASEVMFEDESNPRINLIVKLINPSLITFSGQLDGDNCININPDHRLLIEFKVLTSVNDEEKDELKRLRNSFETEWIKMTNNLINSFVNELVNESRQYLPKSSLINEGNKMIRCLIRR